MPCCSHRQSTAPKSYLDATSHPNAKSQYTALLDDVLPCSKLFCKAYEEAVEVAVRLDAACILFKPAAVDEYPEMLNQCVRDTTLNLLRDRYGMPMGIEPLSFKRSKDGMVAMAHQLG